MIKIAITGNIGSGKSTITKIVRELGFKVFDSDLEVENVMMKKDLIKKNRIDRIKLGEFVFANPEELKKLEKIVHPKVWESRDKFFETNRDEEAVFLDIPLLFENKLQSNFDFVIRTYVSPKVQKERVLKRKNMTHVKFNQIIKAQKLNTDVESKFVSLDLNTEEDIELVKIKVENFLKKILKSEKAAD